MPPKHFGAYFASGVDNYDVQRSYHYVLDLSGLSDTGGDSSEFSLAVQNVKIPDLNNNPIEFSHGATTIKLSGQAEFSDVDITIVDFVGFDMEKWLSDWYDSVCLMNAAKGNRIDSEAQFSQVGKQNYSSAYKKTARLLQLPPDGNQSKARIWELHGMFPTSFQPGSFDYSSNDKKQITMTFSIDFAYRV